MTDEERRSRLGVRHGLAPSTRYADPVAAATGLTALHTTEVASVPLSLRARVDGVTVDDVRGALERDRSLVVQLGMRRTLWTVPRDLRAAVLAGPAARVAEAELRRLAKDVEEAGLAADGLRWFAGVRDATLEHLAAHPEPLSVPQLRAAVPALSARVVRGTGRWTTPVWVATPVTTVLGARGDLVRGPNAGEWWQPRPTWTTTERWLGTPPPLPTAQEGYAELVRRWLWTCGPGTEDDLVWWLGSTRGAARAALAQVEAVEVRLEDGAPAYLLPDDLEPVGAPERWAALLPTLDPTTMGWRHREFHLADGVRPGVYDSAGNGATTAWCDGRVVGCWVQDEAGVVEVVPLADVDRASRRLLDAEAGRLTRWLDGVRVTNAYTARQRKSAPLP